MPTVRSSLSMCTVKLELLFNGTLLSTATGFFFECDGGQYLITNRHNVTGRHQDTGKPLSDTAGLPNELRFRAPAVTSDGDGGFRWPKAKFELFYTKWALDSPNWLVHPELREKADVVAFKLNELSSEDSLRPFCANKLWYSADIYLEPAMPISVIGYPFGVQVSLVLPVWVTGSIASEPEVDALGKPTMLIDCRTNKGSSGSPVFAYAPNCQAILEAGSSVDDPLVKSTLPDGKTMVTAKAPLHRFLGIYSGRINEKADIGFVWRQSVIEEICRGNEREAPLV